MAEVVGTAKSMALTRFREASVLVLKLTIIALSRIRN